jgi:hypothetical protein
MLPADESGQPDRGGLADPPGPTPGFMALLRFRAQDVASLMVGLRESVAVLAAKEGFRSAEVCRAVDDPELVVLHLTWDTVGAYRRALSAYDVKVQVVPVISQAIDEPTAFEELHVRDARGAADATGALAADAGTVRLGHASADIVPPAPS